MVYFVPWYLENMVEKTPGYKNANYSSISYEQAKGKFNSPCDIVLKAKIIFESIGTRR